jgi:hypothetical protein
VPSKGEVFVKIGEALRDTSYHLHLPAWHLEQYQKCIFLSSQEKLGTLWSTEWDVDGLNYQRRERVEVSL